MAIRRRLLDFAWAAATVAAAMYADAERIRLCFADMNGCLTRCGAGAGAQRGSCHRPHPGGGFARCGQTGLPTP